MSKKKINKIKTKQKQKQKQTQIVNVNIHKPTRKPREGPSQPKKNILPTPQYIYTSQTDNLVPQMFNKEGKQQNIPTLAEQINKALDEKVNKLVSQYSKPATQPTQQEVRQTRTETYKNKQKMIKDYTMNKSKQEAPKVFQAETDAPLTNTQYEIPVENEPILIKQEPETISSIYKKSQPEPETISSIYKKNEPEPEPEPESEPELVIRRINRTKPEIEKASRERKTIREKIIKINEEITNKENEITVLDAIYNELTSTGRKQNTLKKTSLKKEINNKKKEREPLIKKLEELSIYKKKNNELLV